MERPTGGTPAASALARHCEATGVSLPRCGVVNGQLGIGYCGIMALRNYDLITLRLWGSDWSVPESQPGPARPSLPHPTPTPQAVSMARHCGALGERALPAMRPPQCNWINKRLLVYGFKHILKFSSRATSVRVNYSVLD